MFSSRKQAGAGSRARAFAGLAWPRPPAALQAVRFLVPWLLSGAAASCAMGLAIGFALTPAEVGRDDLYRIVYIHVPATWAALLLYALLVFCSSVRLMTGMRAASMMAEAIAPTGALFALLALWTGSLWSKAGSDVWWDWDARRLADLTLLTFFVACALLREALDDTGRADLVTAVLALAGAAIVVVVLHSVELAPLTELDLSARADGFGARLFVALALVTSGFMAYAAAATLKRLRCVILERERSSVWIEQSGAWR